MNNSLAYFELAGPNVESLAEFYGWVFGWDAHPGPFPGYLSLGSEVGTERGGGFRQEATPECVVYVRVEDLQATLDQALAGGGKVVIPPTNVPGVVYFALFEDPAGNRVGILL